MVYLTGKLLFALLVERRAVARLGSEWTQMLTTRVATWWRIWKLLAKEVQDAVLDTVRYYRPNARWAAWASRVVKVGMVLLVVRKGAEN
jgi:hypothetical protein